MTRANRPLLFLSCALCACFLLMGFGHVPPASAHDELISTSPADGSSRATAPSAVTLKFSDTVLAIGSEVVVKTAAGANWVAGPPAISGSTVTTRLRPGGTPGKYTVAWRVVSADGHPVSGTFSYTVRRGSTVSTTSPHTSPANTASTTQAASPTGSASTSTAPGTASSNNALVGGVTAWITGAAVLIIAIGAVVLVSRSRKQ